MNRRTFLRNISLGAAALGLGRPAGAAIGPPNIVVIVSDDQGYADVSYNKRHQKEVATPNTDALARGGVTMTQGYTSGHVCSPTRAGLMTGRYQQRFGVYSAGEGGSGVPLGEKFFPQYLKQAGYASGMFGKWHLGLEPEYNPVNRGFDEFYGFMGRGAHAYFNLAMENTRYGSPIQRGLVPFSDEGYLTTRITEEAVSFIERHKDQPFFAYVAYNAVHIPAEAPAEDIALFDTGDAQRDILMAMIKHLDLGVGAIAAALKKHGLFENTLLIYLSDNGGAAAMHADNTPLRGFKQDDYEGGIHVPFIVSWPRRLKAGAKCAAPVISLDILPTALAAAGIAPPEDGRLDGKNMLPAIEGKTEQLHAYLCWNSGDGKWAIRQGDWKLVAVKAKVELFNLKEDPGETADLAGKLPETVKRLAKTYDTWLDGMAEPIGGSFKRWGPEMDKRLQEQRQRKRDRNKNKGA